MKLKKVLAVAICAAMLTSAFCSVGSLTASADTADATDTATDTGVLSYPTYSGSDLGSTYTKEATTFKVWAPSSTEVGVRLYSAGSDEELAVETLDTPDDLEDMPTNDVETVPMDYDSSTGVWSVTIDGDLKNLYYTYFVKNSLNPDGVEVCDIYAKAVGVNGDRAMVVDLDSTDPEGWDEDNFQRAEEATDAIVWEVHIKDFSYDPESGVSDENRGKYLAFTEFETTLNNAGDVKTCMNYLKDLGITYVQINPMYDFGSVDETGSDTQFNWGYDPKNYNVPEGSYSSNPYDGNVRINELKQMIQALHENGIGVIMDVVYNHTYASEDSWFNLTVPEYYYRINEDGTWSNGSGCGNDTASEREMFKNFMIDSTTYWANEYHVDGFRFDLMGLHDCDTMNAVRAALDEIDPNIITYGEGWTLGSTTDTVNWAGNKTSLCTQAKAFRIDSGIGFFNDDARDDIKGKAFDDLTSAGYVSGAVSKSSDLVKSIAGHYSNSNWKTQLPSQNIMYADCHDNQTLWDRLVATTYGLEADYTKRYDNLVAMNKLSSAIVLTSQGVPFLLAGEEFSRTKLGDDNSYKSSPDLNMLDWSRTADYADVVSYYKGMIDIRKNFDAFSDGTQTSGKAIQWLDTPTGVIGYSLDNLEDSLNEWASVDADKAQWDSVLVYFNGSADTSYDLELPGEPAGIMGDVDGDGKITAADSLAIYRAAALIQDIPEDRFAYADVDGDGKITTFDALRIMRVVAMFEEETTFEGNSEWVVIADDQTAGLSEIETVSGTVTIEPSSALILVPKDSFVKVNAQEEENCKVVVNHIDKDTGEILHKTTIKGVEGQTYTTNIAEDLLVEYDFDSASENTSGTMTEEVTEVNYYYKLFEGGIGTLTVRYVDEDGNDLADPVVTTARGGTQYTVGPKTFPWYKLDETQLPDNASGEYVKEGVEVVFVYESVDEGVESTIYVKLTDGTSFTPYIYVWDDSGKFPNPMTWPGVALTETDENGWYSYTFENGGSYNWILNDGAGNQTADMTGEGDIWITADGSPSSLVVTD